MLPINGIVTVECLCAIYGILVNLVTMLPSSSCHKTSEKIMFIPGLLNVCWQGQMKQLQMCQRLL